MEVGLFTGLIFSKMAASEVNNEVLGQLEAMGFPLTRAIQALEHSGKCLKN